jgi:hypothetical protein
MSENNWFASEPLLNGAEGSSPESNSAPVELTVDRLADASSPAPIEALWKDGRNPDRSRICTAHRTNGEPCRKTAIRGGVVCATHGGSAPAVKAKARVRLEMAADRMAEKLLKMATDDDVPASVKLAAMRDALDRAGLAARQAVSVEVGPTPEYEALLTDMAMGGSRSASRAARGMPQDDHSATPDWLRDELTFVDAEVVTEDKLDEAGPRARVAQVRDAPVVPNGGLLPMEDALDQLRASAPPPMPMAQRRSRDRH